MYDFLFTFDDSLFPFSNSSPGSLFKALTTDSRFPQFPHNPFNPKKPACRQAGLSSIYSVLKLFTGFDNAARKARYPTVIHAITIELAIANIKTPEPREILYEKSCNHLCIK